MVRHHAHDDRYNRSFFRYNKISIQEKLERDPSILGYPNITIFQFNQFLIIILYKLLCVILKVKMQQLCTFYLLPSLDVHQLHWKHVSIQREGRKERKNKKKATLSWKRGSMQHCSWTLNAEWINIWKISKIHKNSFFFQHPLHTYAY